MEVDEKFAQAAECKIDPAIPFPPPILVLPDRKQTDKSVGASGLYWKHCSLGMEKLCSCYTYPFSHSLAHIHTHTHIDTLGPALVLF